MLRRMGGPSRLARRKAPVAALIREAVTGGGPLHNSSALVPRADLDCS